jgi:putative endonuclease
MWSVYVLKSISSGKHYVGIAQDINKRLQEHNAGKSKFTSGHLPWKLIYYEAGYLNAVQARNREKYLKTAAGKKFIQKQLQGFHPGN